jgi:hypothetical protein
MFAALITSAQRFWSLAISLVNSRGVLVSA